MRTRNWRWSGCCARTRSRDGDDTSKCGSWNAERGISRLRARRGIYSALRVFTVRPDFVFPKSRTAVFVDGCFWHGCPKHGTKPKGNASFWRKKFAVNKARDRRVNRALRRAGWQVLRVWEHELKRGARNAKRGTPAVVRRIQQALRAKSGE